MASASLFYVPHILVRLIHPTRPHSARQLPTQHLFPIATLPMQRMPDSDAQRTTTNTLPPSPYRPAKRRVPP